MSDPSRPRLPYAEPVPVRSADDLSTVPDLDRKRPSTWRGVVRAFKRFRAALVFAGTVAALTASAVGYFARASVVDQHSRDIADLKAAQRYYHEDMHWTRDALYEMSRALRVTVPPLPDHDGGIPQETP